MRTSRKAATAPTNPRTWSRPAALGRWLRPWGGKRRTCQKLKRTWGVASDARLRGGLGVGLTEGWWGREIALTEPKLSFLTVLFLFFHIYVFCVSVSSRGGIWRLVLYKSLYFGKSSTSVTLYHRVKYWSASSEQAWHEETRTVFRLGLD